MKIYLDLVFLLNFFFDFLLLLSTSLLLRRNTKMWRLLLGALIGSLSMFLLFIKITSAQLFFLKIVISYIMVVVTFKYKDIKYTFKNMLFLYTISMILGGCLYYLNTEYAYKQEGLVFYHDKISINIIVLCILTPILLYVYIKEGLALKNNYSNYYPLTIKVNKEIINCSGYLDTGNKLVDPYKGRPIILYYTSDIEQWNNIPFIYVPYKVVNGKGLLKCIKIDELVIKNVATKKNIYMGLMEDKISIDGVDCILNIKLLEE